MLRNSESCTECGKKIYIADPRGRCEECSSVCHYCGKSKKESGEAIEIIAHQKGMYMAHRSCHA